MRGLSVHIGLNCVHPRLYGTWNGDTPFCENDAMAMYSIAVKAGIDAQKPLLTKSATKENVRNAIAGCCALLHEGDFFFLSFAGHGFRRPNDDTANKGDFRESWIVYDNEIIDSELRGWLALFRKGVRLVVVSESCNSGGILPPLAFASANRRAAGPGRRSNELVERAALEVPFGIVQSILSKNKERYRAIDEEYRDINSVGIQGMALLFAACAAHELAYLNEAEKHGLFTSFLLREIATSATYAELGSRVHGLVQKVDKRQTPTYKPLGITISGFENSRPFIID